MECDSFACVLEYMPSNLSKTEGLYIEIMRLLTGLFPKIPVRDVFLMVHKPFAALGIHLRKMGRPFEHQEIDFLPARTEAIVQGRFDPLEHEEFMHKRVMQMDHFFTDVYAVGMSCGMRHTFEPESIQKCDDAFSLLCSFKKRQIVIDDEVI